MHLAEKILLLHPTKFGGITLWDRLHVLLPNDPESCYRSCEITLPDMLRDIQSAKIIITNYHAFKLREKLVIAKGTRQAIEGWRGDKVQTLETEGEMIQRVMGDLTGQKNIVVLNDEAHHCNRERVKDAVGETEDDLSGDEKSEAKDYNEAARTIINKTPLGYKTNRIVGGVAPSVYLAKLEKGNADTPPIDPAALAAYLASHAIDAALLRADRFADLMADREDRLMALIAAATGHPVVGTAPDLEEGQDIPQDDQSFDLADSTTGETA